MDILVIARCFESVVDVLLCGKLWKCTEWRDTPIPELQEAFYDALLQQTKCFNAGKRNLECCLEFGFQIEWLYLFPVADLVIAIKEILQIELPLEGGRLVEGTLIVIKHFPTFANFGHNRRKNSTEPVAMIGKCS